MYMRAGYHLHVGEGSEEESQVGPPVVVLEDVRPSEAEAMILPRTPDESLVVDVARGLDSGSMIEQAHRMVVLTFCITLYMVLKCPEIICAKAIFLSSQLLYQSSS